jgi:hypothetical protein
MELHIDAETVEPEIRHAPAPSAPARVQTSAKRFGDSRLGSATIKVLNWAVVIALIAVGYVGAGAINSGIELASNGTPGPHATPQVLAVSTGVPR